MRLVGCRALGDWGTRPRGGSRPSEQQSGCIPVEFGHPASCTLLRASLLRTAARECRPASARLIQDVSVGFVVVYRAHSANTASGACTCLCERDNRSIFINTRKVSKTLYSLWPRSFCFALQKGHGAAGGCNAGRRGVSVGARGGRTLRSLARGDGTAPRGRAGRSRGHA